MLVLSGYTNRYWRDGMDGTAGNRREREDARRCLLREREPPAKESLVRFIEDFNCRHRRVVYGWLER